MEKNLRPILSLPCKTPFHELSSGEKGYHCSNCDKVLTDFRGKTDEEVVRTIQSADNKICGIFHPKQYDFKTSQLSFSAAQRRVGLSLLGILGFLGPVVTACSDSQSKDAAIETKQKAFNNLKFPMKVEGTLKDEKTGKPLGLAMVSIYQNGKVIRNDRTDENGNFSIVLQKGDLIRESFDFILSKDAYETDTLKSFVLGKTAGKQKIQLTLKAGVEACVPTLGALPPQLSGEPIMEGEVSWTPEPVMPPSVPCPEPPTAGIPMVEYVPDTVKEAPVQEEQVKKWWKKK